jgi:hypothetical protein
LPSSNVDETVCRDMYVWHTHICTGIPVCMQRGVQSGVWKHRELVFQTATSIERTMCMICMCVIHVCLLYMYFKTEKNHRELVCQSATSKHCVHGYLCVSYVHAYICISGFVCIFYMCMYTFICVCTYQDSTRRTCLQFVLGQTT